MSRAVARVGDARAASRVLGAVQSGLQAMPFSTVGSYMANGDPLYASRGGERFGSYLSPVWNDPREPGQAERGSSEVFSRSRCSATTFARGSTRRLDFHPPATRWPAYSADGQRVGDDTPRGRSLGAGGRIPDDLTREILLDGNSLPADSAAGEELARIYPLGSAGGGCHHAIACGNRCSRLPPIFSQSGAAPQGSLEMEGSGRYRPRPTGAGLGGGRDESGRPSVAGGDGAESIKAVPVTPA